MTKLLILFLFTTSFLYAEDKKSLMSPNYHFIDLSVNYLDWTQKTEDKTNQKDFVYLELEGGAGWDWGEFYGFSDLENPTHSYYDTLASDLRLTLKPILDIYVNSGFNIHIQNFYLNSESFYVNNLVAGVSYKYTNSSGFWMTPFIGAHYQNSTYYSGFNGYMLGWVFNYDFSLFEEDFFLFNWNEIEFARAKKSYLDSDGKGYGLNGALSVWWKLNSSLTAGLQYRYAKYKLGADAYQSAPIYSLKYYF